MRRLSDKRRLQLPDEAALKAYLIDRHGGVCQWCGDEDGTDKHEIGRGKYRCSCVLSKSATLLLGPDCHRVITRMATDDAERLGLAILRATRSEDYWLADYLKLTTPHAMTRITDEEVARWSRRIIYRLKSETKEYRPEFV